MYSIERSIERLRQENNWYRTEAHEPPAGPVRGVNVAGYLRDESGLGAAARGYVHALQSLGVPLALTDLSALSSNRSEDHTLTAFDDRQPYDVNLMCIDAGQHFPIMWRLGEQQFEDRYNVGVWAWELPRFPERWYDRFAYYHEIWVATSFIANALSPISPVPIVRIPPVLTPRAIGSRERGRRRLKVAQDDFVYLFIFDVHSHMARKNPLAVIDAFKLANVSGGQRRLVIKCVNARSDPDGFAAIVARAAGAPIEIYDGYWPSHEVADLMAACDAYVSLHRSEGTGLTITDALALGKPVIATGWSGNMDFMTVANSFPVRYRLVEIAEQVGPYTAGVVWAEPEIDHAAELMRFVSDHREQAGERGKLAARDIAASYALDGVARSIAQRLDVIATRHRFTAFRHEMRGFHTAYQRLIEQVHETVHRVVPPDATVLVISKGDSALLEFDGRRGWHFPRTDDGTYAGYHPANSAAAITHLEALRADGADYLLIPGTSLWYLDHYADFQRHMDDHYARVWSDPHGIIYQLSAT